MARVIEHAGKARKLGVAKDPVIKIVQEQFDKSYKDMGVRPGWRPGRYAKKLLSRPVFEMKEHWWHHEAKEHLESIAKKEPGKAAGDIRESQLYSLAATYANLTHLINAHAIVHYSQKKEGEKKLKGSFVERMKSKFTKKKMPITPEGWMAELKAPISWAEVDKVREMIHQQKHVLAEMYRLDGRTAKAKEIVNKAIASRAEVLSLLEKGEPSFFEKIERGVDTMAGTATAIEALAGIPAVMTLNPIIIGGWLLTLPAEFGLSAAVRGLNKVELHSLKRDLETRPDHEPLYEHLGAVNKMVVGKKKRLDLKKFRKAMESSPELW